MRSEMLMVEALELAHALGALACRASDADDDESLLLVAVLRDCGRQIERQVESSRALAAASPRYRELFSIRRSR